MSQPLKSTIFAPVWRWTALSAVLRIVGVVAETADKGPSIRVVGDAETSYPNMGVAGASTWDALNLFHIVRRGLGRFAPFTLEHSLWPVGTRVRGGFVCGR
jgi:hypothetical protein